MRPVPYVLFLFIGCCGLVACEDDQKSAEPEEVLFEGEASSDLASTPTTPRPSLGTLPTAPTSTPEQRPQSGAPALNLGKVEVTELETEETPLPPIDPQGEAPADPPAPPPLNPNPYLAELEWSTGRSATSFGELEAISSRGLHILEDTPLVTNDRVVGLAAEYEMTGMCYGMAYLVGHLSQHGRYHPEADKTGISQDNPTASLVSGGLIKLDVNGYATLRDYTTAMPDQFYELSSLLQVERNTVGSQIVELRDFLETSLFSPPGTDLTEPAVVVERLWERLRRKQMPLLGLASATYAHAVLVYRMIRCSRADLIFVYDPNERYDETSMHATIIAYDREKELFAWDLYRGGSSDMGYNEFQMLAVVP